MFTGTKPRAKPRVMAHIVDAGCGGESLIGKFECKHCGWKSGWISFATTTEGKRGVPCGRCNKEGVSNG